MTIQAVIFDIGGVLIHEMDLDLAGKWSASLGLPAGELAEKFGASGVPELALIGAITREEAWQRLAVFLGFTPGQLHAYQDELWSQCFLYAEMARFLKSLRPRYKTATLSNDWPGAREENNRRFGLDAAIQVDLMLYSAEEGLKKPDPRIYELACARLGVPPHETLFLDNSRICVEAARQLGMHSIHFRESAQALVELKVALSA